MDNIYLIIEDSEQVCIRAKTMTGAVDICLQSYLDEAKDREKDKYSEESEMNYYYNEILQSCSLIGKLGN